MKVFACLGLLLLAAGLSNGYALAPTFSISGRLANADESAVNGTFAYGLRFYADATTSTAQTSQTGTIDVEQGVFSILVSIPSENLGAVELWYDLSIDTDANGFTAEDLFGERFQLTAVPAAIATQPPEFFLNSSGLGMGVGINSAPEHLHLARFVAPPGGMEFSKIGVQVGCGPSSGRVSWGLYDTSGTLICKIGPINVAANLPHTLQTYVVSGRLAPSQTYFFGFGGTGNGGSSILAMDVSPIAGIGGVIPNAMTGRNGDVPDSFNPADFVDHFSTTPSRISQPPACSFIK